MNPAPPAPGGVPEGTAAAIVALVCLGRECERLAVELRTSGIKPRTRLMAGDVMSQMLRAAVLIEAIEEDGRPTPAERRLVAQVKASLKDAPEKPSGG